MSKMVTLTIDGQKVEAPAGMLIVDAAKKVGIDIPVFCYHPKMEPVGMCRMCLVDVGRPMIDRASGQPVLEADGSPKLQFGAKLETACTTPVSDGMVVVGLSDKVQIARKEVVELLLTSHPLDCPICDKGGECPLQNLTMAHGPGESRFLYDDKKHLAKHVALGDLIFLDRERCIQCARCVRFQSDIADDPVIGFYNRGRALEIATFSDPGFDSYFSGNTTDICPVGALTTADFRFGARPWELRATASICTQCPVGCNLTYNVRREARSNGEVVIKRAMPRQNESVNEIWICDKGRFTYHYTESAARLTKPLLRKNGELSEASWEEALQEIAVRFKAAGKDTLALVSGRLSNEDLYNVSQVAAGLGGKIALYSEMAGGDLVSQIGLGKDSNLQSLGQGDAILVVASDLEEEAPIWWLRIKQAAERGATLIVANPRPTKLEREAAYTIRYRYGQETATVQSLVGKGAVAEAFAAAKNAVVLYGSEGLDLSGSQALAQACANLLISTGHIGKANNGLIAVWRRANDQGAWELGLRPQTQAALSESLAAARAIYIAAADPAGDVPALSSALYQSAQAGAFVVVQELFLTETARMADVVLPAQAYTEREGSFTSGERRVQRFYPAVRVRPEARADYEIAGEIGRRLDLEMESANPARIMAEIVTKVAAFSEIGVNAYRKLAAVEEQWPVVGRGDVYYGGTSYENSQGLGIQLTPAAQKGAAPALSTPKPPALPETEGGMLAVPVTLLYDRGVTVLPSALLAAHIPQPYVVMHPDEAVRLRLRAAGGETAAALVSLNGLEVIAAVRTDENVPAGIILAPRSLGLPISGPAPVTLRLAERTAA